MHLFLLDLQDIGVGVYDVNNEDFDASKFQPTSTRPIVKFNGLEEESDSDDDGSDDSNLYYEFNSDREESLTETNSITTKATSVKNQQQ